MTTTMHAAQIMAGRQLLHLRHAPEKLVDVTIQPIMLVVLFGYLFGAAFHVPGGNYLAYLLPGMLVQAIVFTASGISVAVANDKTTGFHDRTRTLPAPGAGLLLGRVLADTAENALAVVIMLAAGLTIGWRPHISLTAAITGFILLSGTGWLIAWAATAVGLACRSAEAATGITMVVILPLTFISDTFIPASTMPNWIRPLAAHNPVTYLVDTLRNLTTTSPNLGHALVLVAVVLIAGLAIAPVAARLYER